jgi:capping protein alpha
MAEEDCELNEKRKREIAKWFLLNSPAGEIQYIAKGLSYLHCVSVLFSNFCSLLCCVFIKILFFADLRSVLNDEKAYNEAALEAFPLYNKSHFICLELPDRSGEVSLSILFYFALLQCNVCDLIKLYCTRDFCSFLGC